MLPEKIRIALIGPESTGKTHLCERIAAHYNSVCVPEYARIYLSELKKPYTKSDVIHCVEMQIKTEDEIANLSGKYLFADTELINFRIWLLDKYGDCPQWIEDKIHERKYDLYLLTHPDLPFVDDPLRENPERREYFLKLYRQELEQRGFSYEIIKGNESERFRKAVSVISKLSL